MNFIKLFYWNFEQVIETETPDEDWVWSNRYGQSFYFPCTIFTIFLHFYANSRKWNFENPVVTIFEFYGIIISNEFW